MYRDDGIDRSLFLAQPARDFAAAPDREFDADAATPRHHPAGYHRSHHAGYTSHRAWRHASHRAMTIHHALHTHHLAHHAMTHDASYGEAPVRHRDHDRHRYHGLRHQTAEAETAVPVAGSADAHATVDVSKLYHHYQHAEQTTGGCLGGFDKAAAAAGIHLDMSLLPLRRDHDGSLTYFAKDVGPALVKAGLRPAGRMPLDQIPVGAAVVWGASPTSRAGHVNWVIAKHEGAQPEWWSDNHQDYKNPYGQNNYQVYLPKQVAFDPAHAATQHVAAHRGHHHGGHQFAEAGHRHGRHYAEGRHHGPPGFAGINPNPTPFG